MKPEVQIAKQEVGTLVCFALEEEAAPFRKLATKIPDITILITGIGAKNAEAAVRKFFEKNLPKQVLTCGFAGGLNPELQGGDVVFMTGYPALEEKLTEADATLADFITSTRIAYNRRREKKVT